MHVAHDREIITTSVLVQPAGNKRGGVEEGGGETAAVSGTWTKKSHNRCAEEVGETGDG